MEDARVALVAYGFTARSSLHVVRQLRQRNLRVGMLRLQTLWPFPQEAIAEAGRRVERLLIPEMNLGQLEGELLKVARCPVEGLHQVDGEIIHPEALLHWVEGRL
jgi:2-oxoglutarate ferredoxin oxidoreductase subunit alpha